MLQAGAYRYQQTYLFQRTAEASLLSRLPTGLALPRDTVGPTARWIDAQCEWPWAKRGGDWVDSNGTTQGPAAWVSLLTNGAAGVAAEYTYSVDVTVIARRVRDTNQWMAMHMDCVAAIRRLAGALSAVPPSITYTYTDASTETLACWVCAEAGGSSELPRTTATELTLPVFLEFRRPSKAVAAATLTFKVTQHHAGNASTRINLVSPAVNTAPAQTGIAYNQALDAELPQHPAIIGTQRIVDGTAYTDICYLGSGSNFGVEASFDPAIYGTGPTNLGKLPHLGAGKWIGAPPVGGTVEHEWSIVNSDYAKEGFKPLAAGVAALRMHMKSGLDIASGQPLTNGSRVGYSGTLGCHASLFLPEAQFGVLDHIFVREYFRLGTVDGGPYVADPVDRFHVYKDANQGTPSWTDRAGKFGCTPAHVTSYGGFSGSAGSGFGWQMRHSWQEIDRLLGGPDEGGWDTGLHLYDFLQNVPGHQYGGESPRNERFNQRGGMGMIYAHRWYCREMELKLNSVDRPAVLPDGTPHMVNGVRQFWSPDGLVRMWIDGRLAYERTGMVFRSLPLMTVPSNYNPTQALRPVRQLGIQKILNNWYHGGTTRNSVGRVCFITGLAWGRSYIGPMRMP